MVRLARRDRRPVIPAPTTALGVLGLGLVLGLRHALDVDHLAAVSAIVSRRRSVWGSCAVGVLWGLGHTSALVAAAAVVVCMHATIPPALARGLELGVAAMLVGLGASLLATVRRGGTLHVHRHRHGGRDHVHLHVHAPGEADHGHDRATSRRPFWVGLVHGLAGSAGLMLGVLATIPSRAVALAYVAVFAFGSVGGMVAMTACLGMPVALAAARFGRARTALQVAAACASIAVGLLVAWRVGFASGTPA